MTTAGYFSPFPLESAQSYGSQRASEDLAINFLHPHTLTSLELHRLHDVWDTKVVSPRARYQKAEKKSINAATILAADVNLADMQLNKPLVQNAERPVAGTRAYWSGKPAGVPTTSALRCRSGPTVPQSGNLHIGRKLHTISSLVNRFP
ncbi:hypothetical protein FIBSPDRAFT_939297 [Athelia psychrophila]|uniref:Uncharacterized protein n=1 Tax=Athelia psychrophila TaxID=1759441 RepID=A0A165WQK1_9AGAM|nr:hypothetical protein FIBSPDRAFT_939297 [Fibularhizoctonia sp. CBS 109695]